MARAAKKAKIEVVSQNVVTQEEIVAIADLRAKIDALAAEKKALDKLLTVQENKVIQKLEQADGSVEAGHYVATLDKHLGRCTPSWKDEAIKLAVAAGKNEEVYEQEVKALYPPKLVTDLLIVHQCNHCGAEKEIK